MKIRQVRTSKGLSSRLAAQPSEVIDRNRVVSFSWDGVKRTGFAGDTVVSALAANGVRTLSRSFKYHRPRGVFSGDLHDPNCFMTIDGRPNSPAAHVQVRDGLVATSQNAWPSLRFDVKAANRFAGRFLSAGFYYKTFMAPAVLREPYQRVLQRYSPGGALTTDGLDEYYDKRFIFHDVVVAGAGPAGIAAALGAAEAGASVLLVDEEHGIGGHLRWGSAHEQSLLAELCARLRATQSIEVLLDSTVFGRYDHNWIGIHERSPGGRASERLHKGRPDSLIVATGVLERPYVFAGNDLPGVMLPSAAQRMLALYAVKPGERAVVFTANAGGDHVADRLEAAGVTVRRVDARVGGDIVRGVGRSGLEVVELAGGERIEADLLVTASGWTAQTSLLTMSGISPSFDDAAGRFVVPASGRKDVLAVGGLVGDGSADQLVEHGLAVGRSAITGETSSVPALALEQHPFLVTSGTEGFVDLSEDVIAHDIDAAVSEGYASIELAKRYTTATMGPTQGAYSMVNTVALHANATGLDIESTGTPTWRPPYTPVTLGALAGRKFHAERRTPIHGWHDRAGATFMQSGGWLRPQHYGDASSEAAAVRESVGMIDVGTLGKFELVGRDVPRLLELVYVNRWSALPVGSVRYGLMCGEDGTAIDDGVTGRVSDELYVMSATTSGTARVDRWIREWLLDAGRDWDVSVTDITDAYASMNIAGPRSRDTLSGLVDGISLASDGLGYMKVAEATVAGIPGCFIWRIGFTGELAYEVYVPAGHGLHVWEAAFEAGHAYGIRAFGVEAQRTLRIEKGHAVIGQDTDATTGPFAIGLGRLVKVDKTDMAGLPELKNSLEHPETVRKVLVALHPLTDLVPPEASQVVQDGRPIGRVTSSCWSPALGCAACLALVERRYAIDGRIVDIMVEGRLTSARISTTTAQVDPQGVRLRD